MDKMDKMDNWLSAEVLKNLMRKNVHIVFSRGRGKNMMQEIIKQLNKLEHNGINQKTKSKEV